MEPAMTGLKQSEFAWQRQAMARLDGWQLTESGDGARFDSVSIDSRNIAGLRPIFVAIPGNRFDGHDYVDQAIQAGAAAVVVDRSFRRKLPTQIAVYKVSDTRVALGQLASMKRRKYAGQVIAITGSAGKTTTTGFISQLIGSGVSATIRNFNNEIGVPLSIFAASMTDRAWILELGMNHAGEIERLTNIAEPTTGVLLPAGMAHAGAFKTAADIRRAKAELAFASGAPGRIVAHHSYRDVLFGQDAIFVDGRDAAYGVASARVNFPAGTSLRLSTPDGRFFANPTVQGRHFALPILFAWAACRESGLVARRSAGRLDKLTTPPGRMQLRAWRGGWVLNDAYNASPGSWAALVDYLDALPAGLKIRLVAGEMLELGRHSRAQHDLIADRLASLKNVRLTAVGRAMASALTRRTGKTVDPVAADTAVATGLAGWRRGTLLVIKGANGTGLFDAARDALGGT